MQCFVLMCLTMFLKKKKYRTNDVNRSPLEIRELAAFSWAERQLYTGQGEISFTRTSDKTIETRQAKKTSYGAGSVASFRSGAVSVNSPEELKEIRQAKKQRFWDYFSMVFSISYGIFIVVASVAAYCTDLLMGWSYQTNVGEYWNLALCTIGIILLLFLCFDIRRYMNLVMGMHKGSNKVDGIKLVEGEDGELHIEVPMQKGQKRNVPEYYGFTTGRSGYVVQKKSVK